MTRHKACRAFGTLRYVKLVESTMLDPYVWLRWHFREWRSHSLVNAAKRYGIKGAGSHRAGPDSEVAIALLFAMVKSKLLPDDVAGALAEQARLVGLLEAEQTLYGLVLYEDRSARGLLRHGDGPHLGTQLALD